MAYTSIPSENITVGKAVTSELMTTIKDNLDDHESRINGLAVSLGAQDVINEHTPKPVDDLPVGTILWGNITETGSGIGAGDIQTAFSSGRWFLCDGSDASLYYYGTSVPDLRGRYVRMRALGSGSSVNPDGDESLGTLSAFKTDAHTHDMTHSHTDTFAITGNEYALDSHTHTAAGMIAKIQFSGSSFYMKHASAPYVSWTDTAYLPTGHSTVPSSSSRTSGIEVQGYTSQPNNTDREYLSGSVQTYAANGGSTGGNETSPITTHENAFIKVDHSYQVSRDYTSRVANAMTLNNIQISTLFGANGTGDITIDVKKATTYTGTRTSILASVWNINTDGTTNINNITVEGAIASGEYVFVEVTSAQENQLEDLHVFVAGTV